MLLSNQQLLFNGTYLPYQNHSQSTQSIGKHEDFFSHEIFMNITSKTSTYYAYFHYLKTKYKVFVKGPFKTWNDNILYQAFVDELKPFFGLQKIGIHIAKLDYKGKPLFYLIMRDFGDGAEHYPTKEKDGVKRIDKDKIPILQMNRWLRANDLEKHPEVLKQYVDILLFRQIIESSDTNNTNIIVNGNKVLSVDENHKGYFLEGKLYSHRPTKVCAAIVATYLKKNKTQISEQLKTWKKLWESQAFQQRLNAFGKTIFMQKVLENIEKLVIHHQQDQWQL
ncbi:MAG: hypothetical protein MK212_01035 [Saprospiraceae bacterium]|nr:hypothetical protein [Saprospiraceae bacterium]